jgi:hypothetical protein
VCVNVCTHTHTYMHTHTHTHTHANTHRRIMNTNRKLAYMLAGFLCMIIISNMTFAILG